MTQVKSYALGQSPAAARRLELQDTYFGDVSERLLDMLALKPGDRVVDWAVGRAVSAIGCCAGWARAAFS